MKIEKINDNQIRCTLTREDLASRHIRISELAYGSEKAKELFREMMTQAMQECGFEVDNTPLMIEAVPTSADSMILIITKVEDPDELDSRFSRFSPEDGTGSTPADPAEIISGADDILDLIQRLSGGRRDSAGKNTSKHTASAAGSGTTASADGSQKKSAETTAADHGENSAEPDDVYRLTRFYLFRSLQTLIRACHAVDPAYSGESRVFKNPEDGNYFLILRKADTPAALFNRTCNVVSEYGMQADYTSGMQEYFTEHLKVIIAEHAIEQLRQL